MAGILACWDKIPYQCHAVIGTDSNNALTILDRFRGKDSAPFVDGLPYRDFAGADIGIHSETLGAGGEDGFCEGSGSQRVAGQRGGG